MKDYYLNFQLKDIKSVKSEEEAQGLAIEYQNWASEQNLSYGELVIYTTYFEALGTKFGLLEEFKENGII